MVKITETDGGIRFEIRVQPRSSQNQIIGAVGDAIKVKLTAPPVEGQANQSLIAFLADVFSVPKRNVSIIKGDTSRNKIVEIQGIDKEQAIKTIGLS